MKKQRRICCVEGVYGEYESLDEPSIRPMLELLSQWEYWPHVYERCRVIDQMTAFLSDRWWPQSKAGSILYFATHGWPGGISLTDEESDESDAICLRELGRVLSGKCDGRFVHFSGCDVLKDKDAVRHFLKETAATAVSGYGTEVGWAELRKSTVPLELMLFNRLWEKKVDFSDRKNFGPELRKIKKDLQCRFSDSKFKIVLSE